MSIRIAVVTAGLSEPSSTRLLADRLADATARDLAERGQEVTFDVIELRPLAHALADHLMTGFPTGPLADAIETVGNADALIAVTPVFTASYSGLFKTFFDVLDKDLLAGMPVLLGATAGTARHSLVLDHALRPLFAYLRASVVPTGVFAASEDFGSTADGQLGDRVRRAAAELAGHLDGRTGGGSRRVPPPVATGALEEPRDFEDLLAELSA